MFLLLPTVGWEIQGRKQNVTDFLKESRVPQLTRGLFKTAWLEDIQHLHHPKILLKC